jgi:hypothetical protein
VVRPAAHRREHRLLAHHLRVRARRRVRHRLEPASNGCAPVGSGLRLLLPDDRGNGPVAGLAPDGAEQVRLHWRDGKTTTLVVVGDGTFRGFAAPDGRRADQLTRVDALTVDGSVIASERP